jgi:hypothetical protein
VGQTSSLRFAKPLVSLVVTLALENLLSSPHDAKERARLEVLVAREAYGLDADDWQHLTGTFTYGSGDTKAELDEIIARSCEHW